MEDLVRRLQAMGAARRKLAVLAARRRLVREIVRRDMESLKRS